jgi:hypothetical protein
MKRPIALMTACAAAAGLVSGCGGDDNSSGAPPASSSSPPPPTSSNQSLDTAQVLAMAKYINDVSEPFAVNGGALTLTDTSETSEPVTINGM